jgi:hypothetical protein
LERRRSEKKVEETYGGKKTTQVRVIKFNTMKRIALTVQGLMTTIKAEIAPNRSKRPIITKIYTPRESFQPSSFLQIDI